MTGGTRATARVALLLAAAVTLQIAESLIPKPIPWLRLGLANGVALLALVRLGFRVAAGITVARILLGALLLGTLGAPPFFLSLGGGILSLVLMGAAVRWTIPHLSLLGVSILGSVAHAAGQLVAFSVLFDLGFAVARLAPILVITAVPLGLVTGWIILAVHRRLPAWDRSAHATMLE